MLYLAVLWVHIVGGVVALGSYVACFVVLNRGVRDPASLPHTLSTVQAIGNQIVTPAYAVTAASGALLVWWGPWSFTTPWVFASIVLFVAVAAVGPRIYVPSRTRQTELAAEGRGNTDDYRALHRRAHMVRAVVTGAVLAILWLMVVKPVLWG